MGAHNNFVCLVHSKHLARHKESSRWHFFHNFRASPSYASSIGYIGYTTKETQVTGL